jgi:hypothetical protein
MFPRSFENGVFFTNVFFRLQRLFFDLIIRMFW